MASFALGARLTCGAWLSAPTTAGRRLATAGVFAFPRSLEAHFSTIHQTPAGTSILVRFYQVEDGGLDADGQLALVRTLLTSQTFDLSAAASAMQLVTQARTASLTIDASSGLNLGATRVICDL